MPRSYSHSRQRTRNSRPRRRTQNKKGPKKEYIDPKLFVKAAKVQDNKQPDIENSFSDFQLHPTLHTNLQARNFSQPSPIQDQIIPHGLQGRDTIGIANTGTGKTLAFALPILNTLMHDKNAAAIIIAPTRELAEQVLDEFRTLTDKSSVRWALLIGGSSMHRQLKDMSRRPNLVVGTPGRIKDHIERQSLKPRFYNMAVLDEVDRMLDMGFVNDMRSILGEMPTDRQSFFFSATMDNRVRGLIDEFSINPIEISVKTGNTSDNVDQNVVYYRGDDHKFDELHSILGRSDVEKVLIFEETRGRVERLHKKLGQTGFSTDLLHGGRSQGQRKRALQGFKDNNVNILVATDVAARGIDVSDVTYVINYSTPQSYADYVHRVGRAGRAGRQGYALTFLAR